MNIPDQGLCPSNYQYTWINKYLINIESRIRLFGREKEDFGAIGNIVIFPKFNWYC